MVKIDICPKCGKKGSLVRKWVKNAKGERYEPYYYVAHYVKEGPKGKPTIKWCYIPREKARELLGKARLEEETKPKTKPIEEKKPKKPLDFLKIIKKVFKREGGF